MVRSQLNRRIEGRISSVMIRIWTFRVWDFEKRPFSRVHFWIKLLEITVSFISVEKFWRESFGLGLYWASLLTYCDFFSLVKNKSFIRLGFFLYWRLSICVINYVFWKLLLVPFWVRFVLSGRSLTRHPVEILLWFVICLSRNVHSIDLGFSTYAFCQDFDKSLSRVRFIIKRQIFNKTSREYYNLEIIISIVYPPNNSIWSNSHLYSFIRILIFRTSFC